MFPPREPVYQWGQKVRALADLANDGSFPDHPADALLVIESMKLQLTITAACSGTVEPLPLAVGQTFQRGAVLARVTPDEEPT